MLLRLQIGERERVSCFEIRQKRILLLFGDLRAHIDGGIPFELELGAMRAQLIIPGCDLCRNRIVDGSGHLTCRKALPDQRIEAQLIAV